MKHRRFLSVLLTMVMMMSMFASIPFAALAEAASIVIVTDWDGLQDAVKKAAAGQTIQLGGDITCKKNGGDRIKVDGKTITIDLYGHTLDRNRTKSDSDGHVIEIVGKSSVTIKDSVGGGVIRGGYAKRGGGINVGDDATCVIEGGTITGNKATYGGGIYVHGTLTMNGGTVTKNEGTDEAGGIFCNDDSVVTLNAGVVISENEGEDCGGVFNEGGTLTMTGVKILNNKSTDHGGGGVNMRDKAKTTLINCTVTGNEAEDCGGGIYVNDGCELTVDGGTISSNRSTTDDGGGIYSKGTTTVKGDVTFKDNYCFASGGAIRVKDGTTTVEGGTFENNEAGDSGGAIYVNDSTLKLYGGTFTGNRALTNDGGGILVGSSASFIVHGAPVVKGNKANDEGNDIFLRNYVLKNGPVLLLEAPRKIELDAALKSGAELGVDSEKLESAFTSNFDKYNPGEEPSAYFTVPEGWVILKRDGEGIIRHSNWTELQALIDAAEDYSTLVLDRDYAGVEADGALNIGRGQTLTLDLNGHTLNRGLKKAQAGGAVIMNQGTLTITDSVGGGRITGGYADDHAGGIWNPGTLTLEGGAITGNRCVNDGGGIHNSGELAIKGGTISSNTAGKDGGGVYTDGELFITGGEIKGNTAGASGGALRVNGKTTTIYDVTMTGNTATRNHGGAIYLSNAELNLCGGSITGNKAAMEGGGILYGANSQLYVEGKLVVNDNSAPTGANILIRSGQVIYMANPLEEGAKLDLLAQDTSKALTSGLEKTGSSLAAFTYNQEQGVAPSVRDGELFVDLTATADVWVSDWKGLQNAINSAKDGQVIGLSRSISANGEGRIKVDGGKNVTLELNGHSLNRGRTSSDGDGHVIEVKGKSTLTITDAIGTGTIKGGWAKRGGGINVAEGSTCILRGGTVTENKADYGGGVYVHGTFKMEGGSIANNSADEAGGGIFIGMEGMLEMTGGTVSGNTAEDCGGIFNRGSKKVTLKNVTITGNTSKKGGGGFNNNDNGLTTLVDSDKTKLGYTGSATLTDCVIRGNTAKGNGGGLWNQAGNTLTLENCTIEGNTADSQGGGIFTKGTLTVTGGAIRNNTAGGNGGAIYLQDGETTFNSGKIAGNTSKASGGGIYVGGATLKVYGGEITGNAAKEGAGIFQEKKESYILIHGAPVVKENKSGEKLSNVQLAASARLVTDAAMTDGAMVYVTPGDVSGIITGVLGYNQGEDPAKYFAPDDGLTVALTSAGQVVVVHTDWYQLQKEIDAAADGATVTLQRDWQGGIGDEPLTIREGKTITLDLNGHTLDRNKDVNDYVGGNGNVIKVLKDAKLTIRDSVGTGVITGGHDSQGGGIFSSGALRLEGGAIKGNTGTTGGGVYIYSGKGGHGSMTMTGGRITGNTSEDAGGIASEGELTISGGEITDNVVETRGGALYISEGTTTITGGVISRNTSGAQGGGIYVDYKGTLDLQGGKVTGNTSADGGGVYVGEKGTLNVQDEPVVENNTGTRGNNIFLPTGKVINVTDVLDGGAHLDLTAQDLSNPLTKGLMDHGNYGEYLRQDDFYRKVFTYNNGESVQPVLKDFELFVDLNAQADVYVSTWSGLQKAIDDAKDGTVIALSSDVSANGADRIQVGRKATTFGLNGTGRDNESSKTVTLDLNGYTLDRGMKYSQQGRSDNGHVIEVKGESTLTIRDTRGTGVITGGNAKRGGGVNIAEGSTCILESGTITENGAEYGGGVYVHGTFKMTGGTISGNGSSDSGGGIHCGSEGTLELTGGIVTNNQSAEDGGGIYNSGSKNVTIENVHITYNTARGKDSFKQDDPYFTVDVPGVGNVGVQGFTHHTYTQYYYGGAGFSNDKGGIATLKNCVITGNHGYSSGGGVYNTEKCTLTLENCTVENNIADANGGGVCTLGKLTLNGGSYSGNSAGGGGGGIMVSADDNAALDISGALEVHDNKGGQGANVYLSSGKAMTVAGAMKNGAKVGLTLADNVGVFARDFAAKNPNQAPNLYFASDENYILELENGDAMLEREAFDPSALNISRTASYENVNSRNWLSAVPGERQLNDINIPGTHDSSMNSLRVARLSSITSVAGMEMNARTQYLYIDEQLNAGIRWLDLRCNNKCEQVILEFTKEHDDGENLWMCHGKEFVGTVWAANHDGDSLSLKEVLGWVKDFLRDHPTEFVVLDLCPETRHSGDIPTIKDRIRKYVWQLSQETNPSTGKPYLYMENNAFAEDFSRMPQLKDVRGQIVLCSNETVGGLEVSGYGYTRYSPEGSYTLPPEKKAAYILDFYKEYGGVQLPRDVATHLDIIYRIYTNSTNQVAFGGQLPVRTPVENEAIVFKTIFDNSDVMKTPGNLIGWVTMDAATAKEAALIWRTNFYDMDMVTVTVDSGLSAADLESGMYTGNVDSGLSTIEKVAEPKLENAEAETESETEEQKPGVHTFRLIKGTEITLPECLYTYDQTQTRRGFQSWNVTGETENATHLPGETFAVMEDMTISGQWLMDGETSLDIKWQDADDADSLRADSLDLEVWPDEDPEHVYTRTVTAAEGWRAVLEGDAKKIVPVWERIDGETELGADTAEGYRYEVADAASAQSKADAAETSEEEAAEEQEIALTGSGLILTLVHTPQEKVAAAGAIEWNDYGDRDGLRPESVTLHLFKGEEKLDSRTVTAEDEWQYDFGELPAYEDGLPVAYSLTVDEIPNYTGYAAENLSVTLTHVPTVMALAGGIQWEDADNEGGQRPEGVTVRLLANGEEINRLTVTADGAIATLLDVPSDDGRMTDNGEAGGETGEVVEDEETYATEEEAPAAEPAPQPEPEPEQEDDDEDDANEEAAETAANNWWFRFYGVPVHDHGEKVTYSIVMDGVAGYSTETLAEDGTWFTNTLLPQSVTVAFDGNGGEGEMEAVEIDPKDGYVLPDCGFTAPEGMEFAGWTLRAEVAQAEEAEGAVGEAICTAGAAIAVTENITAVAQWQPIPEPIVITFDANGGEGEMAAAEPDENGEYTLPDCGFTAPEGMAFAGWKLAVEAEETDADLAPERVYQPGDTIDATESITIIAQWQAPAKPIVITFDANGGEGEMEAATVDEDGTYTLPESAFTAPEGMAFAGWRTVTGEEADEEAGHVFSAGDVIVVVEDTTVVAQWQAIEAPEEAADTFSVTITFQVVNGTWDDGTREPRTMILTGSEGEELRLDPDDIPQVITPDEGYELGAWDIEPPTYMAEYDLATGDPITEDTTYTYTYARIAETAEEPATAQTWMLLFDENGGEGEMESAEAEDQGEYTLPENSYTAPEGMIFAGWLVGEELLQPGDTITVTEDTLITAQWQAPEAEALPEGEEAAEAPSEEKEAEDAVADAQPHTWMVMFYENGGEGEMESVAVEGETTLPENGFTAPEGTHFAGWLVGEDVYQPGDDVTIGEDTIVTAQWEADEPEVVAEEPAEEPAEDKAEAAASETPVVEQPEAEQPAAEQPAAEQPEAEQPAEEDAPVEESPAEAPAAEEPAAEEDAEPASAEAVAKEKSDVEAPEAEEPEVEEPAAEKPAAEEPAAEKSEVEASEDEAPAAEAPAEAEAVEAAESSEKYTVSFDGGGADGEMEAVEVAAGSEFTLPDCEYAVEGCAFECWAISGDGIEETFAANAGDTIVVNGNITAMALWTISEDVVTGDAEAAPAAEAVEDAEDTDETPEGDMGGLTFEYEETPEESTMAFTDDSEVTVEEASTPEEEAAPEAEPAPEEVAAPAEEAPSEIGSVFGGAGTAAIVAAIVLVLAAAGIALARKKKK